ncbi:Rho GTPase-activating protein 190 [Nymphon striatum]|nr:Rho GTPase-activating protein 190 [Nymphon striatum]
MAKKLDPTRAFNIAVVGLSGTEKDKGNFGVGKSCLCNRFIRPLADDYYVDHICVLSQTDFSGRVVNNDHFLFWGDVTKTSDEGSDINFQVVEQTEFIDDSSFQPFKSGKTDPYYKRCSATKLQSAEKLMYICKNQLGIEKEYEQKVLPDGKFCVDGFLCVFDVSPIQNRTIEKQVEYTALILNNLMKSKKPILVATTKCDEANDSYIREAEKLINRKEYKGNIPLVETSAHENVNVELAFILLSQMIDRTRGRSKIIPFYEAARAKKEILDVATEAYQILIRTHVTDYRALWNSTSKNFASNSDFIHYCELFGRDVAQRMFRRHVKKLKEDFIGQKMRRYIEILPEVYQELLPDVDSVSETDWDTIKLKMQHHPDFSRYFLDDPDEGLWHESKLVDSGDTRIPLNLLDSNEAITCFRNHVNSLQAEQKRVEKRKQFKQLLGETGYVTPGKLFSEVRVLFMGRECFEELIEDDLNDVYVAHQREITDRAKFNFQELLLEHADVFYHFASYGPGNVITQEDIREITEALQDDSRYKLLDKLDQDRTLMLLQHLGFVHGPIREHCPAYPDCMDSLIEKVIAQKAHSSSLSRSRPSSWNRNSQWVLDAENNQLNLVLLGSGGLADELANAIRMKCVDDTIEVDKTKYSLDYRIIDGDVNLPQNSFRTSEFLPHGCFCIYSSHRTLEYIRDSLEKTLLSNLEQEDRLPFHGLPIVIVFAADSTTNEKDLMELRDLGQHRAKSLQCPFIDVSCDTAAGQQFLEEKLMEAMNSLIESIQRRAGLLNIYHNLSDQNIAPDIRIIMCMLCGDPFSVEHVLAPLLSHQCCFITSAHSVTLETYLGDSKRSVEVRVSSYHGANVYRDELVHGFILVYSTKRRASLATLDAFSMNISSIPIQVLAMTEAGGANAFFSSDLSHQLITEGNAVADKLQAHFMTSTSTCQQKTAFYTPFFKEVWEKKAQIERAFNMEDEDDDDEEDDDEEEYSMDEQSPHQPPPIPSRQESYHLTGSVSPDEGSGDSEGMYEHLHPGGEVPLSPEYMDDPPLSPSDDSEIYAHVYGEQENGEHLIKPSQIKNRQSLQADLYRQSYPSTESLDRSITMKSRGDRSLGPTIRTRGRNRRGLDLPFPPLAVVPCASTTTSSSSSPPQYQQPLPHSQMQSFGPGVQNLQSHQGSPYLPPRPGFIGPGRFPTMGRRRSDDKPKFQLFHRFHTHHKGDKSGVLMGLGAVSAGRHREISDEDDEADDDDSFSSQMRDSGFGTMYPPPPEPAPPDVPPRRIGHPYCSFDDGWVENRGYDERLEDEWPEDDLAHSHRIRRTPPPTKPKPRPKCAASNNFLFDFQPGKLNLKQFDNITDAVGKLKVSSSGQRHGSATLGKNLMRGAPLATPEGVDMGTDYAHLKDAAVPFYTQKDGNEYAYATVHDALPGSKHGHRVRSARSRESKEAFEKGSDSDSDWSSLERVRTARDVFSRSSRKPPHHKKTRKRRSGAIPVSAPRLPASFLDGSMPHPASSQHYSMSSRIPEAHSLDPLNKARMGHSPSEGSDLSSDECRSKTTHRLKYKHKKSFKLKRKKQLQKMGHQQQPLQQHKPIGIEPYSSITSDTDMLSASSSFENVEVLSALDIFVNTVENVTLVRTYLTRRGERGTMRSQSTKGEVIAQLALSDEPCIVSPLSSMNSKAFQTCRSRLKLERTFAQPTEEDVSFDMPSPRDPNPAALRFGVMLKGKGEVEKIAKKKEKQKSREDEKLEKRRLKEEERQRRQTEKKDKKKKIQSKVTTTTQSLEEFVQSEDKPVPLFIEKCMQFVEEEGVDSEGIYRVPGNRAHVDLLFQKFEEDPLMSIKDLDIPVNAVATALKDFFSKRLPPLFPPTVMEELQKVAGIQDKSCRLIALRDLLKNLPSVNFEVLKFVFNHFVKVSENCKLNSMDSKNLAICWWPTLLPFQFTDMGEFESMRPNLEDAVQTMIDQFRFLFCGEEEVLMV